MLETIDDAIEKQRVRLEMVSDRDFIVIRVVGGSNLLAFSREDHRVVAFKDIDPKYGFDLDKNGRLVIE